MGKRVTVYNIAEELGISPSTVSRVLNNSSLISDERSKQILETAERLGYEKRPIRKHMSRAILNIHLFLPQTDNHLTHFFYNVSELIESIQEGFGEVRLNITTRVNDNNLEFLEKKKTGQIDACVFAFTSPSSELSSRLDDRSIPFLLLNRRDDTHNYIAYDIPEGMTLLARSVFYAASEPLRPCYIGFGKLPEVSRLRYETLTQVFRAENIPFDETSAFTVDELSKIPTVVLDWILENGFNAVFAFNDLTALSIYQGALERGVKIPEDMALTGFDDSPIQNLLTRRIDTVRLSIPVMGQMAGGWLKSCIIDKEADPLREILPVKYIRGGTV
ncbi:MAG: LacI family DNA-binding transcriptional regulator [Spirochaetales bacterium]|nr:LacI family DNA-binding transcriptional regulator [Spirochaetales bacterium]